MTETQSAPPSSVSSDLYRRWNEAQSTPLIYRVGIDAGFFAEHAAMVLAMLEAMRNGWKFCLYGDSANFGYAHGWEDFFEPFCPMDHHAFHARYNIYKARPLASVFSAPRGQRLSRLAWNVKLRWRSAVAHAAAWRTYGRRVRLNSDVALSAQQHYTCPALGIDADYMHAFRALAKETWHFNRQTSSAVARLRASLGMGSEYVACQLRGGDKVTETNLLPPARYVEMLRERATTKDVFVLTDDYRLFEEIRSLAPEFRFFTLCRPEERGYVNSAFIRTDAQVKRESMERFLASMQILLDSRLFFGSITAGPSLFLLKMRYPEAVAVDCAAEDVPHAVTLPIAGRSQMASEFLARERGRHV